MAWTTAQLADHYKRQGLPAPEAISRACGDGQRKYRNQTTEVDGEFFDSKREADHYRALRVLRDAGQIANLRRQVPFLLQERFADASGKRHRAISYVADFVFEVDGQTCVVESKGFEAPTWRLKEKLFRAKYPHIRLEVWK